MVPGMTYSFSFHLAQRALLVGAALLALPLAGAKAEAAKPVKPRMVIELFTSQGCSSCPAADKLAGELAEKPDLVVLSFPVDYWDYLGWRDTLASPAFTARQKGYGKARGDRQVYTPQAVVNGVNHAIGSEWSAISAAATGGDGKALSVPVTAEGTADRLKVTVGAAVSGAPNGAVWFVPTIHSRMVAIGRGENTGRSVVYTNVARGMFKLGDWTGAAASFDVPADKLHIDGADGYVVLLQGGSEKYPGVILGAAQSTRAGF